MRLSSVFFLSNFVITVECRWCVLRRHQGHQRLPEISGYVLEYETIIRIYDHKKRSPCKWIQISGVKAVRFFLFLVFTIPLTASQNTTQVIAHWKRINITTS